MAASDLPFISVDDLRRAAEAGDGQRDESLVLCELQPAGSNTVSGVRLLNPQQLAKYTAEGAVKRQIARSSKSREVKAHDRETETRVTIRVPNAAKEHVFTGREADAVFWTESAIEKFFFPYYARQLSRPAYEALVAAYYQPSGDVIWAFIHYPTSEYWGVTDSGTSASPLTGPTSSAPSPAAPASGKTKPGGSGLSSTVKGMLRELAFFHVVTARGIRSLTQHLMEEEPRLLAP